MSALRFSISNLLRGFATPAPRVGGADARLRVQILRLVDLLRGDLGLSDADMHIYVKPTAGLIAFHGLTREQLHAMRRGDALSHTALRHWIEQLAENWPDADGVPWPADIPRPDFQKET